jgi:hypothetical protein
VQYNKHQRYNETPFSALIISYKKEDIVPMYEIETGEEYKFSQTKKVDDTKRHTKVFDDFFKLASKVKGEAAVKLALYFAWRSQKNSNYIYVDVKKALEYMGATRATYNRAILHLIDMDIIANAEQVNKYWINTELFFNGKRQNEKGRHQHNNKAK